MKLDRKMSKRMKNILMNLLGAVALVAFLVMCREPLPGENPGVWEFTWPKVAAMGVIAGCVWGINRLDKMIIK